MNVLALSDEATGITYNSNTIGEHINSYFANIGKQLADNITGGVSRHGQSYENVMNNNNDSITNTLFTRNELTKVIKCIDVNKLSGMNEIRSEVFIHAIKEEMDRMLKIYNQSILCSIFPSGWKISTVVPLPKV